MWLWLHSSGPLAAANSIRVCYRCRQALTDTYAIPEHWWSDQYRNSNGYFGCAEEEDAAGVSGLNTWAFFETKQIQDDKRYKWLRMNIFTRYLSSQKQIYILLFDTNPSVFERLKSSFMDVKPKQYIDSMWPYLTILDELVRLEDAAVWSIRDQVRTIELEETPTEKCEPDYRRLHDIARHAIHVNETLDVSKKTLDNIIARHQEIKCDTPDSVVWWSVHQRFVAAKTMIESLRGRSISNEKRLQNEIQLAFNIVALQMGRATQTDSAAMKTVSVLTLAFLPPTFISAIFSMSFFNFDPDSGWAVSSQFWMYWAFALPLTLLTSVIYYYWQGTYPSKLFSRAARGRNRHSSVI
ncbi:hypothetical protein BKA67DRAFT_595993 [Truncatella angustata]|uniref:Uncharacterized protein n=1 Tax=Truncatella angustata TaxID=152316 RepID=A0A9P8RKQ9_9PEZI|nr:uncharacterized protein BKA67DRAFT_595993 [Truncatella angustata]KAH6645075.1 hypothetical protein BKA67DRAFT_595993 [Truncatella angustata]